MNALLKQVLKEFRTLEITLLEDGETLQYTLEGFYKYNNVSMIEDGENLLCSTRYDIKKTIHSWDEMVEWNYDVWNTYCDSFYGWASPEEPFYTHLAKSGRI